MRKSSGGSRNTVDASPVKEMCAPPPGVNFLLLEEIVYCMFFLVFRMEASSPQTSDIDFIKLGFQA